MIWWGYGWWALRSAGGVSGRKWTKGTWLFLVDLSAISFWPLILTYFWSVWPSSNFPKWSILLNFWVWFSDQTGRNREPLINPVLLILKIVLRIKSMKSFESCLNQSGLKTVHSFHNSDQSNKKKNFKLLNLLLLACLSIRLLEAVWPPFFGHSISVTHHSSLITHHLSL